MRFPHRVKILHPALVTDRYGDQIADWAGDGTNLVGVPAWMQQRTSTETPTSGRDAVVTSWVVFLPLAFGPLSTAVEISAGDRIEYQGETFEVTGDPLTATTPRGAHHLEAQLQIVRG